ncbi:MAG TPA: RnfABCDGE type electron transport complex subunit B [Casimicrobiaceae bacterium]|jgi:electron transport complex protein RnfB
MPHRADLAERIDLLLPQTQCGRCAYPGCRPYAEAIAEGAAPINRCAPGGQATIARLAALLDVPAPLLDPAFGVAEALRRAHIDEAACIGCTLCIRACPVDAIVGATQRMHTVLLDHCTGCGLCLPPCPVDCIVMTEAGRAWTPVDAAAARIRFDARNARLARVAGRVSRPAGAKTATVRDATPAQRRQTVAAAVARARARRGHGRSGRA